MDEIHVLLVDDEEEFRRSTTRVLERRGFRIRTAGDGETGLRLLAEEAPDVVVLDLRMPGLDGIETLKRIREDHEDLPVIILTGHGGFPDALAGIHLKIVDFLQKPCDPDDLAEKIRKSLTALPGASMREKSVSELMLVLDSSYPRVSADATVREALRIFTEETAAPRSILVMDDQDRVVFLLRRRDVMRMAEPGFLQNSPYSSFRGMFVAQCKVLGDRPLAEFLDPEEFLTITEQTPLMKAVSLMVENGLVNLPVMRGEKCVGILRDRDLCHEILHLVVG